MQSVVTPRQVTSVGKGHGLQFSPSDMAFALIAGLYVAAWIASALDAMGECS